MLNPHSPSDLANARYLGRAADLAYYNASEGPPKFAAELGLTAKLISVDNTQVYLATSDEQILLAFRGSENPASLDGLKDWLLTNAVNMLVVPEGRIGSDFMAAGVGARFHFGFMSALAEVWDPLKAALDAELARKDRPVWVTGHSLGGALATLAAWRLEQQFVPVTAVTTFGAPMIGNQLAANAFETLFAGRSFRYIDDADLVPRLPTISFVSNQYVHVPTEVSLGSALTFGAGVQKAFDLFHSLAQSSTQSVLQGTVREDLWKLVLQRIDAHLMPNYITLLKKHQQ